MLRRNYSDPTCASEHGFKGIEVLKGSVCDLRDDLPVRSNWNEVKRNFADALAHDREISRETERENMHFYLSEILLAAIEKAAWNKEVKDMEKSGIIHDNLPAAESSNLSFFEVLKPEDLKASDDEISAGSSTFYTSVTEVNHTSEDSSTSTNEVNDGTIQEFPDFSAEATASSLLKLLSTSKLLEGYNDASWLVPYVKSHAELDVGGQPIRLRGSSEWAPPRRQWIFSLNLVQSNLKQLLELQNNMCAGCGMKISKVYARRMQMCNYYNKLFCQRCHQGAKMRIPARILHQWNFREFPVSDIARHFLMDNYSQPVINVLAVDRNFYEKCKRLQYIRALRLQLVHLWSFIRLCSVAKTTVTIQGNLHSMFSSLPKHLLEDPDVFSMVDFDNVRNGSLAHLIEPLVRYGKCHVNSCEVCQAKGFVCELCDQHDDLLFPFQLDKVDRCGGCGSLSHPKCAARRREQGMLCPKCVRIALNSARHREQLENTHT